MADVLQTVLQLVGGQQYVAQLNQAARAHQTLARAQEAQARSMAHIQSYRRAGLPVSAGALATAGGAGIPAALGGAVAATALGAISAVAIAVKEATSSFVEYDRAVIKTQFTLQNMGRTFPVEEFRGFARQLSVATGTSETDLVNLAAYLARFKGDAPTIERSMRAISDAAAVSGKSVEEMGHLFEMMRTGHAKEAFKELGIPIRGVTGMLYDQNQIVTILEQHYHDLAVRMGKELPGQLDRATAATKIMQNELGNLAAPALSQWAKFRIGLALGVADIAYVLRHGLSIPDAGAQAQPGGALTLGGVVARNRSEDYLRRIELNTGPQGAMGRAVRGGGSFNEPGAGMHIRDLALMVRHQH